PVVADARGNLRRPAMGFLLPAEPDPPRAGSREEEPAPDSRLPRQARSGEAPLAVRRVGAALPASRVSFSRTTAFYRPRLVVHQRAAAKRVIARTRRRRTKGAAPV